MLLEEIESWYAAGLDEQGIAQFGMPLLAETDRLTKEQFDDMVPEKFDSRIDFMMEVLKIFSLETARKKNKSFDYFLKKAGSGGGRNRNENCKRSMKTVTNNELRAEPRNEDSQRD